MLSLTRYFPVVSRDIWTLEIVPEPLVLPEELIHRKNSTLDCTDCSQSVLSSKILRDWSSITGRADLKNLGETTDCSPHIGRHDPDRQGTRGHWTVEVSKTKVTS